MTLGAQEKIPGKVFDYGGSVFNVQHLDFGAAGDGVVDDTAAIETSLAFAKSVGGGMVFLPKGTYLISSDLIIDRSVNLVGAGAQLTTLKANSDSYVVQTGTGNWHHLIKDIYFDSVGIRYGTSSSDFGNGATIKGCEVANVDIGIQYEHNCWQTLIEDCKIHDCTTAGVLFKFSTVTSGSGAIMKIVSSAIFDCPIGVDLDEESNDGVSIHLTDLDIEHCTTNAIRHIDGGTGEVQFFTQNLHLELNTGGAWVELDSGCTAFFDNFWAFPSGSYDSLFKLTGSARAYLRSGRVQWEVNKLVELAGGILSVSQDFNFGASKFFGLGSNPMAVGSSTDGLILNGAPGHDTYPNDVGGKVFPGERELTTQAAFEVPNQVMSIIQAYDASTRVWEFVLETTALNGSGANNTLRFFLNPGGTVRIDLGLPAALGLGIFKLTYRPDTTGGSSGRLVLSGHYTVTATGATTTYLIRATEPGDHWKEQRFLEIISLGTPDHADITVTQWYEYVL